MYYYSLYIFITKSLTTLVEKMQLTVEFLNTIQTKNISIHLYITRVGRQLVLA